MSKVFLSHSSQDKPLVRAVFQRLGANIAEMDEYTFESGPPNWEVILNAFERCSIFVLFATNHAAGSLWVQREVSEAKRRLRSGTIKRILIFVSSWDDYKNLVPEELRDIAAFIGYTKAVPIFRAIQRHLVEIATSEFLRSPQQAAFVGRDRELSELKSKILNPERRISSISIAGPQNIGRSALLQRAISDINPTMLFQDRPIDYHGYESCVNLALKIYAITNDTVAPDVVKEFAKDFESDDPSKCASTIYSLIRDLKLEHHHVIISDQGGIINYEGRYTELAQALINQAGTSEYPLVLYLTQRRPSIRARGENPNTAFIDIGPLRDDAARQYAHLRANQASLHLSRDQLDDIVDAGMGIPSNYDYIIELCKMYGVEIGLADLTDVIDMTSNSAKIFFEKISISENAKWLLKVLRVYPAIPGEFIPTLFKDTSASARACSELIDWNIVVEADGIYSISRHLSREINRNSEYDISVEQSKSLAETFVEILSEYSTEGRIPVSAIDTAGIATIEAGSLGAWSNVFVLPSHYIYLARRCYDRRNYIRALDFARTAAKSKSSLSRTAYLQACRIMGMSAARLGREEDLGAAIRLFNAVTDPAALGWAAFIRGFACRLDGKLREAEAAYLEAEKRLTREYALHREMALVYLLLRRGDKALGYGEFALERSPSNPYVIDTVVKAILSKPANDLSIDEEIKLKDLLNRLKRFGSSDGFSFYQGRMAEKCLQEGNLEEALRFADEAVQVTSHIAAVYLTRARVKLAKKDLKGARADLKSAKDRQQHATYRIVYFDREIDRVEIDMLIREKRWREAIAVFRRIEEADGSDVDAIRKDLKTGIRFDNKNLTKEVESFLNS